MKSGEKFALRLVIIAFLGIAGFTIYLELDYRKTSPLAKPAPVVEANTFAENRTGAAPVPKGIIPTGMNPDDLPEPDSRGATVLTLYCAQCHELPTPAMHSAAEWPAILTRMQSHLLASKKGMLGRIIQPPEKDWLILGDYLVTNGQRSLDPLQYTDLNTVSGQAFVSTCSQCHAAPAPESHTKTEWPRVVLRMKSNMSAANIPTPEQDTLLTIIDYLQQHSIDSRRTGQSH